jgi:cold shock CspA family protein
MTATGTVTAISADRFGFIAADRHAGEIWIRPRSMDAETQLHIGQRVAYVLALGLLGIEAANVRPLDVKAIAPKAHQTGWSGSGDGVSVRTASCGFRASAVLSNLTTDSSQEAARSRPKPSPGPESLHDMAGKGDQRRLVPLCGQLLPALLPRGDRR